MLNAPVQASADLTRTFNNGIAYEQFMGRWSRAAGSIFLDWVAPARGACWLDVGCGTGVFTELVVDACAPVTMIAVDPAAPQIEVARNKSVAQQADFRVADAQMLPFPDGTFDVVASALVINFIPNRPKGVAEMRRVGRPGGVVAGYVWDFAAERSPNSPIRRGLNDIGVKAPAAPGSEDSRLDALHSLFAGAGLENIATRTIDVTMTFPNFADFWRAQTPGFTPMTKMIAALSETDRAKLIEAVRARLLVGPDDSVAFSAHANAIMAHVPE